MKIDRTAPPVQHLTITPTNPQEQAFVDFLNQVFEKGGLVQAVNKDLQVTWFQSTGVAQPSNPENPNG